MIQNCINHIAFVVDASGSMGNLAKTVVEVFDKQIQYLAQRSKELNQETRVTVYLFDDLVKCIVYDMDVLRMPSLKGYYKLGGMTALIDATRLAISDLGKTPELYGDHAFLTYVLTDGLANVNTHLAPTLKKELDALPDHWTVAAFVPNQNGIFECKKFGFPAQNIAIWDATSTVGLERAGGAMQAATESFMVARSTGVRGTKNLFQLNTSISAADVAKLEVLSTKEYESLPVRKDSVIKEFVESWTGEYRTGSAYYQLVKKETIQGYKQILLEDKANGKVYGGGQGRKILGLPATEVKVAPADFDKYNIYVQSTAPNRRLPAGTKLIVLK